jgi:hypothetical protein
MNQFRPEAIQARRCLADTHKNLLAGFQQQYFQYDKSSQLAQFRASVI